MMAGLPTQDQLRGRLDYDPFSGVLTWKNIQKNRFRGKIAGNISGGRRYVSVFWEGRKLQAHQLIWCLVHGRYPKFLIDHMDGNSRNNAIDNLREATETQNSHNRRIGKNNKSGFKGVSFHKHSSCKNKWRSAIKVNGAIIQLGHFATAEEGHIAYCNAARRYFGEFARAA